jgi:AmmeMemoRadiSam system protein B
MAMLRMTRRPAVAGMFYPADANMLERQLTNLFERASVRAIQGLVRGVIAPHAGYIYSGPTAAAGYSHVKGKKFETVVIVAPSHRDYFEGASVYSGDAYQTPLGVVQVDADLRAVLLKASDCVVAGEAGHRSEHAIEVQLPFLQAALGSFKILPIVMGDQHRDLCFSLAEALGRVVEGKDVLFVASTDLSHYHTAKIADAIDSVTIEDVRAFDHQRLMDDLESGAAEACGGGPTVVVMGALRGLGVKQMEIVHHCNSGDVAGDRQNVVGYLSAVAWS